MPLPIAVADTTVLIALHHLEHLPKLSLFYHQVLIPAAVRAEFLSKDERKNREAEAISQAKQRNTDLILIDEKKGRQIAFRERRQVRGTIRILADLHVQGILNIRNEVTHLRNDIGFRVTDQVVHSALQEAARAFAGAC